jgi:2-C-methyl-D-erythritol 4-phosphate cytidylyltransferase
MHLLIPAAGTGKRMGADRNKLLLTLAGDPILTWTLRAATATPTIHWIGIIGQPSDFPHFQQILTHLNLPIPIQLIPGGTTRQTSVHNGLTALPPTADRVLIHDGARCLATPDLFDRCATALNHHQGIIAAIPVKDTIKRVGPNQQILDTPDRSQLWAAQTPQGFHVAPLKQCHAQGQAAGLSVTDDAALFEAFGRSVHIVEGEETNLKITTPIDLTIAQFVLMERAKISPSN